MSMSRKDFNVLADVLNQAYLKGKGAKRKVVGDVAMELALRLQTVYPRMHPATFLAVVYHEEKVDGKK